MVEKPRILDRAFATQGIPSSAKLLLLNMAKLGNGTGQCFASQQRLAEMCCCDKRTVRRALSHLLAEGLIKEIPNPKRATKRYLLNFHRWGLPRGQDARTGGRKRPHTRGQIDRQNHDLNHKLNHGARNRLPSGPPAKIGQVLEKIKQGHEWYSLGEGGSDA